MITESATTCFNEYVCSHSATITGATGAVYGYYSRDYVEIQAGRATIAGFKPTFTCSTADVSAVADGAAVTVTGVGSFTVAHIEQHDEIESRVILEAT